MDFSVVFEKATPILLAGIKLTIGISLLSILIGFFLGLIACLMGMSKFRVFRLISGAYVWIIRGTPMLVQAFIVFFGVPQVVQLFVSGFKFTPFVAGVITLSLNAGAYTSRRQGTDGSGEKLGTQQEQGYDKSRSSPGVQDFDSVLSQPVYHNNKGYVHTFGYRTCRGC